MVVHEIIPYGSAHRGQASLVGLNLVSLRRRNFPPDGVHALHTAFRLLFTAEGALSERLEDVVRMYSDHEPVMEIVAFMRADPRRPICQPTHRLKSNLATRAVPRPTRSLSTREGRRRGRERGDDSASRKRTPGRHHPDPWTRHTERGQVRFETAVRDCN